MGTSGRPDHMVQPVPDRHVRRVTELSIPVTPEVAVCGVWPLRSQCVAAKPGTGRTVQLHPQEALLQQARALQQSEAFAEYRQRRVVVEHRLARLVQLGIRQSRYFGRAKTRFQLYLAATVANLTLVAAKAGLTGETGSGPSDAPRSLEWSTPPPHGSGKFGPSPCSYRPY